MTGIYDLASRAAAKAEPHAVAWRLGRLAGLTWAFRDWQPTQTTPPPEGRQQTADRAARFDDDAGREWLAVLEFQSRHATEKVDDLMAEAARLRRECKGLVQPTLVYLVGECPPNEAVVDMTTPTRFGLRHAPLIWHIARDDAGTTLDALEAGEVTWGVLFWLPLMSGADDDRMVARWRARVDALPDERTRRDIVGIALVFAALANRGQVWRRTMAGYTKTESPVVNEWLEETVVETTLATLQRSVKIVLQTRFKAIPDDILETIGSQPSPELLEDWMQQAVSVDSINEFRAYLRR